MPVIEYNGYTLPQVIDKFSVRENEKSWNFSCNFLITAATEADLITACDEAKTKLTEINKDFSLDLITILNHIGCDNKSLGKLVLS